MNRITEDELVKIIEMGLQMTLNSWNDTAPTSTQFTVGTAFEHIEIQPDLIWIKNTDPFDNKNEYQEVLNRMG